MPKHEVVHLPPRPTTAHSLGDIEKLAEAVARSRMFGIQTKEQALVLMSISQAEGRHPALAARDYDIISGRPAKKAEAMMRDFLEAGGRVKWHQLDDTTADATFSHPSGGEIRILWDTKRAMTAGLASRDMWKKFPRQMLRSRCVSEGVKTVYPMATSGFYAPEEVADMPAMALPEAPADTTADLDQFAKDTTDRAAEELAHFDAVTGEVEPPPSRDILAEAREQCEFGVAGFTKFWQGLSGSERDSIRSHLGDFEAAAKRADSPFDLPPLHSDPRGPRLEREGMPLAPDPAVQTPGRIYPAYAAEPVTEPPPSPGARDVFRELEHEARAATKEGAAGFAKWWATLRKADKDLLNAFKPEYEQMAAEADAQRGLAL